MYSIPTHVMYYIGYQELHPGDLKAAVENYLNQLLDPIRKKFDSPEMRKLVESAYPAPLSKSQLKKLEEKRKKDLKEKEAAQLKSA